MARSSSWSKEYDCSPETLYGIITSGEFHEARSALLDNPRAEIRETSLADGIRRFEIHTTEYAKGLTGIDRSRTEQSVSRYECDLVGHTVQWDYSGPQGKRVRVWGSAAVTETPRGSKVRQHFNVEVTIPLVGGRIEKMVIRRTEDFWPRYERLLDEWVVEAGRR